MATILKEVIKYYHRGQLVSMMYYKGKLIYDNSITPPVIDDTFYEIEGLVPLSVEAEETGEVADYKIYGREGVVMNQICENQNYKYLFDNNDAQYSTGNSFITSTKKEKGHNYLIKFFVSTDVSHVVRCRVNDNSGAYKDVPVEAGESNYYAFVQINENDIINGYAKFVSTTKITAKGYISNVFIFDLTLMFGSGNEPTSADEFAQRLGYNSIDDVPYIPYNEGEVMGIGNKTINLWDNDGAVQGRSSTCAIEITNWYALGQYSAKGYTVISVKIPKCTIHLYRKSSGFRAFYMSDSKLSVDEIKQVTFKSVDTVAQNFNRIMEFDGWLYLCMMTSNYEKLDDLCINVSDPLFDGQYEPYGYRIPVNVKGRNLWDEKWENGAINASTGEDVNKENLIRSSNFMPVPSNAKELYLYTGFGEMNYRMYFYDLNKNFISAIEKTSGSVSVPSNTSYFRFQKFSGYGTVYKHDICVNISDESFNGQYEPYHNETKTIYLNSPLLLGDYTQYDGQKVHREWGYFKLENGNIKGVNNESGNIFRITLNSNIPNCISYPKIILSNGFVCVQSYSTLSKTPNSIATSTNGLYVLVNFDSSKTEQEARDFANTLSFFYELTNPTEESCTIPSLELTKGTNIINTETTLKPEKASISVGSVPKEVLVLHGDLYTI